MWHSFLPTVWYTTPTYLQVFGRRGGGNVKVGRHVPVLVYLLQSKQKANKKGGWWTGIRDESSRDDGQETQIREVGSSTTRTPKYR